MATLSVSIDEKISIAGRNLGGSVTYRIGSVNDIYHRIIPCPANNDTTIVSFQTAVHTSDNVIDLENTKYIRVSNIDTDQCVMSLQISNNENGTADGSTSILLPAQHSFILSTVHEGIACDDDAATIITDTALHDLESIIIDPQGNDVQVEVFVAS